MVSPSMPHASVLDAVYGPGASLKVREACILVVGAGGVGCELVKNLAISGFGSITLIDLDTIDVSNLNRQFLFRRKHVGHSKALEASVAIQTMVPGTVINGIVGNVMDTRFDILFFKKYTLVCNALDNLAARRHVNRMCLAADVPLVESGSTGYIGQCSVIGQNVECYDCTVRLPQKTYAVCTIRSTPDKPVHCVVWAKFLYELLFGPDDEGNVLKDLDSDGDVHVGELGNGSANGYTMEGSAGEHNGSEAPGNGRKNAKRLRYATTDTPESFANRVSQRVFLDDIERQRAMKDLWKERQAPVMYDICTAAEGAQVNLDTENLLDQKPWSKERSAAIFVTTLQHIVTKRKEDIGKLSFDKDDRDALLFVASASNLRANAYGVPLQSPFAVKGIAGNIVHAIATTNAMVGGLIVLEALKITTADGKLKDCRTTFVSQKPNGSRVLTILSPVELQAPNKNCFVCSKGQLHLSADVDRTTLKMLVTAVLQKKMSILQPTVHVSNGDYHNTLYETGIGLDEDEVELYNVNLGKTLRELQIQNGSQLIVEDFAQNLMCTLHVSHVKNLLEDKAAEERFMLKGEVPKSKEESGEGKEKEGTEDVDEDGVEEVVSMVRESDTTERNVVRGTEEGREGEANEGGVEEAVAMVRERAGNQENMDEDGVSERQTGVVGGEAGDRDSGGLKRGTQGLNGEEERDAKRARKDEKE